MTQIALHIYHLHDNQEAEEIIQLLNQAGIGGRWLIERPTEATNAILVPVDIEESNDEEWKIRQQKLKKAIQLLRDLDEETIHKIKGIISGVAMRVHTPEFYLPIPAEFVWECGRLGLEICIFNETAFNAK